MLQVWNVFHPCEDDVVVAEVATASDSYRAPGAIHGSWLYRLRDRVVLAEEPRAVTGSPLARASTGAVNRGGVYKASVVVATPVGALPLVTRIPYGKHLH